MAIKEQKQRYNAVPLSQKLKLIPRVGSDKKQYLFEGAGDTVLGVHGAAVLADAIPWRCERSNQHDRAERPMERTGACSLQLHDDQACIRIVQYFSLILYAV